MFLQLRNFAANPHSAQGGFPPYVGIGCRKEGFNLSEKISRHLDRGYVSQCTESETNDILIGVIQVARKPYQPSRWTLVVAAQATYF